MDRALIDGVLIDRASVDGVLTKWPHLPQCPRSADLHGEPAVRGL
jgi:hypothetical protein